MSLMSDPLDVGVKLLEQLRDPLAVKGPKEKGLFLQLGYSLAHAAAGFLAAVLVALPVGFLLGLSPLLSLSLQPFVQILKPVSLAWLPLGLYLLKDSGPSVVLVVFLCALWPTLITAPGDVAAVRKSM